VRLGPSVFRCRHRHRVIVPSVAERGELLMRLDPEPDPRDPGRRRGRSTQLVNLLTRINAASFAARLAGPLRLPIMRPGQ
jgi:hypothetical protein